MNTTSHTTLGAFLLGVAALAAACGGGSSTNDAATPGDAPSGDAAAETPADVPGLADASEDSGGGDDALADAPGDTTADAAIDPTFMAIAPCPTPAAYVETPRTVSTLVNAYGPACLRVPAGTSVQMEASIVHPLEPRAGGSPGSPIKSAVSTTTIAFPTPGFYPFLCPEHVDQGMVGVIWVTTP